jgi:UDP-glucuronate 4-epimerase
MEAGRPIPMFGDGRMARDYTYIDDIGDGVIRAMDRCKGYHIYNLEGSHPVSLSDLITKIEAATGRKVTMERLPPQAGDVERTYADVSLARSELGFQPTIDLPTGLARFVEWFRTDAGRG